MDLALATIIGDLWDSTLGGLWDDTEVFRTLFFDFELMGDSLDPLLDGFWFTVRLSIFSGVLSLTWGLVLAVMRQLPGRALAPVRALTIAYIDVLRGVPLLLVLLMISGGLGALAVEEAIPRELGIPRWLGLPDNFWYGVFALTLTYGAYMAEVYRAGIEAVPGGQMEAARSLGMSHGQAMRYVVVPQAVRKVIPPLLNDFIALMKDTSLVAFIGLAELIRVASDVQVETFNSSAYIPAGLFYLIATIPLARWVDWLIARQQERYTRAGAGGVAEPAPAGAAGTGQTGGPV